MKNTYQESIFVDSSCDFKKGKTIINKDEIKFITKILDKIEYGSLIITLKCGEITEIQRDEKFRVNARGC